MKKITVFLAAVGVCAALVGCGSHQGKNKETADGQEKGSTVQEDGPQPLLTISCTWPASEPDLCLTVDGYAVDGTGIFSRNNAESSSVVDNVGNPIVSESNYYNDSQRTVVVEIFDEGDYTLKLGDEAGYKRGEQNLPENVEITAALSGGVNVQYVPSNLLMQDDDGYCYYGLEVSKGQIIEE